MKRTRLLFLPVLALFILLVGLLGPVGERPSHAHAASTITITDCTNDTQLQTAISTASSGDTIVFGCSGDIPLTNTLTISKDLKLDGSGRSVTLDGQGTVRVFDVVSGGTFTLNSLTITKGSDSSGGGLANARSGTVNIINSTFTTNLAREGAGLANSASSTVNITNSTFANNDRASNGGGLLNGAGSTVRITNSTFANNKTAPGGFGGGGLFNISGTVIITNSTFANNSGGFGVLYNAGNSTVGNSTVSITNSTFANNSATGLANGGIASITNSTFANNFGSLLNGGTVNIAQSIMANNSGSTLKLANCSGTPITDQGYNLSNDSSCGFTASTDLPNIYPGLDPNGLQDNGGPTQTIALEPDSPAIDQIAPSSCPPPPTDQRGVSRPQPPGGQCDIGAFETTAVMTPADAIKVMIHVVNSFDLVKGIQTSLNAKLQAALTALSAGDTATTCSDLTAFINEVNAQSGKMLTTSQTSRLLAEVAHIRTMLSC